MIRAIIFDCFGVLLTDALQVINDDLRSRDPEAAERIRGLVQLANRGVIDPEDSSRQVAAILGTTYEQYREQIRAGEIKDMQLFEYITKLRATHKTALLSNIGKGSLLRRFTEDELQNYFDVVIASGEVGYAKPEREIYEITAERLGVRFDECVFTDDREPYVEAARSIGMQGIHYQGFAQFRPELETLLSNSK